MKYSLLLIILIIIIAAAGCITPNIADNITEPEPTPTLPEPEEILEYTYNPTTVEYPLSEETDDRIIELVFPFKNQIIKKQIAIPYEKYNGLPDKDSRQRALYVEDSHSERQEYFDTIINDKANDDIYENLLNFFDEYSEENDLTSDEYVELVTSFVQNITYETGGYSASKYPIETIFENKGDCDDKAILLTGLLSRKGYDVALLFFEDESHMTAAIKSGNETEYPNSLGYSMIELTSRNYIGEVSNFLIANGESVKLSINPELFKIGSGYITYSSSDEVSQILSMREISIAGAEETQNQMDLLTQKINSGEALSEQISDEEKFNEYVIQHNKYAYLANIINLEPFNRAFVYEQVTAMMGEL